jgi:hypothetical protein
MSDNSAVCRFLCRLTLSLPFDAFSAVLALFLPFAAFSAVCRALPCRGRAFYATAPGFYAKLNPPLLSGRQVIL